MSSSNEHSKKYNGDYSRLSMAGGQSIPDQNGHFEIPPKTAKYSPSHIEVKEEEGLIISAGSYSIENGKRIDNTGAVLQNLGENGENRIIREQEERAKITGNKELAEKLATIKRENEKNADITK